MKNKTLILFLVLLASQVSAQGIKIGDIEIPNKIAKEYFLDLYTSPDTINIFIWIHEKNKNTLALRKRVKEAWIIRPNNRPTNPMTINESPITRIGAPSFFERP